MALSGKQEKIYLNSNVIQSEPQKKTRMFSPTSRSRLLSSNLMTDEVHIFIKQRHKSSTNFATM